MIEITLHDPDEEDNYSKIDMSILFSCIDDAYEFLDCSYEMLYDQEDAFIAFTWENHDEQLTGFESFTAQTWRLSISLAYFRTIVSQEAADLDEFMFNQ